MTPAYEPFEVRHPVLTGAYRVCTWLVCMCLGAGFGLLVMLWIAGVG